MAEAGVAKQHSDATMETAGIGDICVVSLPACSGSHTCLSKTCK